MSAPSAALIQRHIPPRLREPFRHLRPFNSASAMQLGALDKGDLDTRIPVELRNVIGAKGREVLELLAELHRR